ncbi:hypothetical protein ACONUD_15550 [Microbulbifer harenosus]|uniref:DUF3649 domain-containing protein n=1 Tax=Microbulbifer harenosus TaxID=2576840 RepID=A0ABY2UKW3_9GAMM|nr:hypothetical protein [Microbulbifer harenosus]TLM78960.1 hypothetical protein FDY93_02285 [Microbulbifer harenosus]
MWPKSIAGFFLGLLVSTSLVLNLKLLPLAIDTRLLSGLLLAFLLWAAVMTYCYRASSIKRASLHCAGLLAVSVALNAVVLFAGL